MRHFLAIEPPAAVRDGVAALVFDLAETVGGWRWVAREGLHVTLVFLGEIPEGADLGRDGYRAAAARARAFELEPAGMGRFPLRGAPRVLWLGLRERGAAGAMARLAAELGDAAREVGLEVPRRPFRPHLTLARARRGERPALPAPRMIVLDSFAVREVTLFRSEDAAGGARYTALERFPLVGGGEG